MTPITIDRALLEQALEALNSIDVGYRSPNGNSLEVSFDEGKCEAAITALKAALAQEQAEPVQEPVSEMLVDDLCLLHLGWKSGPDGDLHRDLHRAAMDRVIAHAVKVRGLRKIKQLEGKA